MRSGSTARSATTRPVREFRVRFPARMIDASLATPGAQLPARPRLAPTPVSETNETPVAATEVFAQTQVDFQSELAADRERIESLLGQVRTSIDGLRADQSARLQQLQKVAVELALTIATRLLHERVQSGEFQMETKVRDMIAQMGDEAPAVVHLNPIDLALLESRLEGAPLLPGKDDPRIVPDASLARGDCRVEGREGMLLSDLTRELQEIRDDLLRSLAHART